MHFFIIYYIYSLIFRHIIKWQKCNAATSAYGTAMTSTGSETVCQVMHLICTTTKTCTNAKNVSTSLGFFRLFMFPFFPSLLLLLLEDVCHCYVAFTYPGVLKAYI